MSASIWEGTPLADAARDLLNSPPHLLAFAMGAAENAVRQTFDIAPDATQFPAEAKAAMLALVNFRVFGADAEETAHELERLVGQHRNRMRKN